MLFKPDIQTFEHPREVTASDAAKASWALSSDNRITQSIARITAMEELNETGEKLSIDVLNKQYDGSGITFTEPVTALAAQFIHDEKMERSKKERVLNEAKGFLTGGIVPFGTGMLSSMADPIDFAINVGTAGVAGAIAKKFAFSAVKKLGINYAENVIANGLAESATMYADSKQMKEYTAEQFAINVVGMSALLPGITFGASKVISNIKGRTKLTAHLNKINQAASAADEAGKSINIVEPLVTDILDSVKVTDDINLAIKEAIPNVNVLKDADNFIDVFDNIRNAYDEGRITDTELSKLRESMDDVGVPEKTFDLISDRPKGILSQDATLDYKRNIISKETDFGYDPEIPKVISENSKITQDQDINAYSERFEQFKLNKENLKETFDIKEADVKSHYDEIVRIEKEEKFLDVIKDLSGCEVSNA